MYYILNETKQIIAADDNLLSLCGVTHIDELSSKIVRGDTKFDFISDESITIITEGEEETFTISKTTLSSMLGHLTLVTVLTDTEESSSFTSLMEDEIDITPKSMDDSSGVISSIINEEESVESLLDDLDISEDEPSPLELDNDNSTSLLDNNQDDEITFGDHLNIDDDSLPLKDNASNHTESKESGALDDSELFDLVLDDNENDTPSTEADTLDNFIDNEPISFDLKDDKVSLVTDVKTPAISEIIIDIDEVSRTIGISSDDYNNFLNDFIDTAVGLEKDLLSNNDDTRSNAINTLGHLSDVLHIPVMGDIIEAITDEGDSDTQREVIESFYGSLSRISTTTSTLAEVETLEVTELAEKEVEDFKEEETLELFEDPETLKEPLVQEEVKPRKTTSSESFGSLSLEGIKPKHFDFQLEEAANDLSLPVELIEEFVHDFIDQAHIETKKMVEAYEEGDLDAIQKIGHLLKGASSNLRINSLSDTLYKIQFCEDSKNLDVLIKDYWAHFLSFENQINVISK